MSGLADLSLDIDVAEAFEPLYGDDRYVVFYGGRGGAKSWSVARALLEMGVERKLRILCCREIQKSIQDSVHALLEDQISTLGLYRFYEVQRSRILGRNGTEFGFEGLKHNAMGLKSWEGADICWVEEAANVSRSSWEILIPTIRRPGSRIVVTFNPQLELDETYQRFVVSPPPSARVIKVNYDDNPWFPEVLEEERQYLLETNPDAYANVWEGHCRQFLDGAIYAEELRQAEIDGRIGKVPHDPSKGVSVYCDLGSADKTTMWFAQSVAGEFRVLDYYENRLKKWPWYLKHLQNTPYLIKQVVLPHDANSEMLHGRSIKEQTREAGYQVKVLPQIKVENGINAARSLFPLCNFDATKCADGLQALRHYRFEVDPDTGGWSRKPLHDDNSHAADAFRYMAMAITPEAPNRPRRGNRPAAAAGWMGA